MDTRKACSRSRERFSSVSSRMKRLAWLTLCHQVDKRCQALSSTYAGTVCLCLQHLTANHPMKSVYLPSSPLKQQTYFHFLHFLHFLQIQSLHFLHFLTVFSKAKVPWQVLVHLPSLHECSEMCSATTSSCDTASVKRKTCFR